MPQVTGLNPLNYGAVWNGSSNPITTVLGPSYDTPGALAAYTNSSGGTPYSWATNPIYGIAPFTLYTSRSAPAGVANLIFNGTFTGGTSAFAQCPFVGQTVTETNIATGTTVTRVTVISDFQATVTLSNHVQTGGVASGAAIVFAMTSAQIQYIEMDWLGLQATEYAACSTSNGWGQQILIPNGEGVFGNTTFAGMELVLSTSLLTAPYWADGSTLLIAGQGKSTSVLSFPKDLGAGRFALKPDPASINGSAAAYVLQDLSIVGDPSVIQSQYGRPNFNMSGPLFIHKSQAFRCAFNGFFASVYLTWDHNYLIHCDLKYSGYALYHGFPVDGGLGNSYFQWCDWGGSLIAAIGVAWNNVASGDVYRDCFGSNICCWAYKEAKTAGASGTLQSFFVNNTVDNCFGEGIFYASMCDANAAFNSVYTCYVGYNVFINSLFSLSGGSDERLEATTTYFPTTTITALFNVGIFSGNQFQGQCICIGADYNVATVAIVKAGGSAGNSYQDGQWLTFATAAVPAYSGGVNGDTWQFNGLSGYIASWLGTAVSAGTIVTTQAAAGTLYLMTAPGPAGQSTYPPAGVLIAPIGNANGAVAYATSGQMNVACNPSAGITNGQAVYLDYTNPAQVSAYSAANPRTYVGWAVSVQSGSQVLVQWNPGPVV